MTSFSGLLTDFYCRRKQYFERCSNLLDGSSKSRSLVDTLDFFSSDILKSALSQNSQPKFVWNNDLNVFTSFHNFAKSVVSYLKVCVCVWVCCREKVDLVCTRRTMMQHQWGYSINGKLLSREDLKLKNKLTFKGEEVFEKKWWNTDSWLVVTSNATFGRF